MRRAGWIVLGTLLAATLTGAALHDRSGWPDRVPGEATYLMQARSLVFDFDLRYERADFDRQVLAELGEPPDLALVSGSDGRRITYDRPFPYALYLAPFLAVAPERGPAIANALLLIIACGFAAYTFERRLVPLAPLLVAVLVFASVTFAYVFLATGDLFLFAVTVLAWGLIARAAPPPPGLVPEIASRFTPRRWLAAGALLAIPAATAPLYGLLPAAALFAPREPDRGRARGALALGFLAALALVWVVGWWAGGGLGPVGATSLTFTPETGYPLVDFTAAEWPRAVPRLAALHFEGAPRFAFGLDPWLWAWNAVYLAVGRAIGLLPYFAPLLIALLAAGAGRRAGGPRRPILVAAALWGLGVIVLLPFNLYGGPGAVANRLFLPVYGALVFAIEPGTRRRLVLAAAVSVALAAPFLLPLWQTPRGYPIDPGEGYRHVGEAARRWLPYEASQRPMPGGAAAIHNDLTVKFLSERGWAETRRGRLMAERGAPVELLVASSEPLDVLRLDFGADAPSALRIRGGEVGERVLKPDGGIAFRVLPRGLVRRHAMWWTPERQWLYRMTLELEGKGEPLAFALAGERVIEP